MVSNPCLQRQVHVGDDACAFGYVPDADHRLVSVPKLHGGANAISDRPHVEHPAHDLQLLRHAASGEDLRVVRHTPCTCDIHLPVPSSARPVQRRKGATISSHIFE